MKTSGYPTLRELESHISVDASVLEALGRIRHVVGQVARSINPDDVEGAAVNWADLGCCFISLQINELGEVSVVATIEEAAPDNPSFRQVIREQLGLIGLSYVEVEFEW